MSVIKNGSVLNMEFPMKKYRDSSKLQLVFGGIKYVRNSQKASAQKKKIKHKDKIINQGQH